MQSCVLFVLSLSIHSSAGWGFGSWAKKPKKPDCSKCEDVNPPSKCLWTPGTIGAVTAAFDVYPNATYPNDTAIVKTTFTNQAVIKQAKTRDTNCLPDATIKVCSVFDADHVNSDDTPGPEGSEGADTGNCPASDADKMTTGNICGLHAHTLKDLDLKGSDSCDNSEAIAGHYFNSTCGADKNCDQWSDSHLDQGEHITDYKCDSKNRERTYVPINTFFDKEKNDFYSDYSGLPFVTHNQNSRRVGCSVLSRMPKIKEVKEFKYSVAIFKPTEQALAGGKNAVDTAKPFAVRINSDCEGSDSDADAKCGILKIWAQLEPYCNRDKKKRFLSMGKCSIANTTPFNNACGMHIHAGTACDAARQGPHYVADNIKAAGKDPWDKTAIGSKQVYGYKNHRVIGGGKFTSLNPLIPGSDDVTVPSIQDRVYVQHGASGDRQWCGVIRQECDNADASDQCQSAGYQCLQVVESSGKRDPIDSKRSLGSTSGWPWGPKVPKPVSSQYYCCSEENVHEFKTYWGRTVKYCVDKAYDNYPDNVDSRMLWQDESQDDDEGRLLDDDDEESSDADVLV